MHGTVGTAGGGEIAIHDKAVSQEKASLVQNTYICTHTHTHTHTPTHTGTQMFGRMTNN